MITRQIGINSLELSWTSVDVSGFVIYYWPSGMYSLFSNKSVSGTVRRVLIPNLSIGEGYYFVILALSTTLSSETVYVAHIIGILYLYIYTECEC